MHRSGERTGVFAREIEFHDALASSLDPRAMPAATDDLFDRALLDGLADVAGRRVLDVGCGDGTLALVLASRGAQVTGFDISPGMIDIARRRAELHLSDAAGSVEFVVGSFEEIDLPSAEFDIVVGKFILHHVEVHTAAERVRAWLKPQGTGLFLETSGFNPLLVLARRALTGRFGVIRMGTEDERPLRRREVRAFTSRFVRSRVEYPVMFFLQLLDRQVLRWRHQRIKRLLRGGDALLHRVPGLGWLSYYVVIRVAV